MEGWPNGVSDHARAIAAMGADGTFTFEGRHDVFLPLVVASARRTST
jgi:hypothetical protein